MKPICYMMIGVPGSGKSTQCDQILKEMPDIKIVSSDEYIDKYAKEHGKTYEEVYREIGDEAASYANRMVQKCIKEKTNFIWDQTNVFASSRKKKLRNLQSNKYDVIAIAMEISDLELEKRLKSRREASGKHIHQRVIMEMKENYTRPSYDEGFTQIYIIGDSGEINLLSSPVILASSTSMKNK